MQRLSVAHETYSATTGSTDQLYHSSTATRSTSTVHVCSCQIWGMGRSNVERLVPAINTNGDDFLVCFRSVVYAVRSSTV